MKVRNGDVSLVDRKEVLRLQFNRKLKSDPDLAALILAVASLVGVARRLRVSHPPDLVAEVVKPLLIGKVGYSTAAAFSPPINDGDPLSALASTGSMMWREQFVVPEGSTLTQLLASWNAPMSLQ